MFCNLFQFPQFFIKMLLPFFLLSILSLPNRCSADSSTETERTLAIIKPDGVSGNHTDSVKETILNHGFKITEESFIQLDEDRVKSFYAEHSSRNFFPSLVEYMTSGPVLIMVLEKGNAIADWRALIGPTDPLKAKVTHPHSVRAICGLNLQENCVHGSDSPQSASREISFFFKTTSSEIDCNQSRDVFLEDMHLSMMNYKSLKNNRIVPFTFLYEQQIVAANLTSVVL